MQRFDLITQANSEFVDGLYQQYLKDAGSVDPVWRAYFAGFELAGGKSPAAAAVGGDGNIKQISINDLVHSYRELGHFIGNLDPLGHNWPAHPLLDLRNFNI